MSAATPAPVHQEVLQESPSIWMLEAAGSTTFLVGSTFRDDLISLYGAPQQVWLRVEVPKAAVGAAAAVINCSVAIFNKTATRLVRPPRILTHATVLRCSCLSGHARRLAI